MPDNLTPKQRSYCMSRIKSKDTAFEVKIRSALHRRGMRFRKHVKDLPGTPDIVFSRSKVAVFIDGDFWHGYQLALWEHKISEFWKEKIRKNQDRDTKNHLKLAEMGWIVIRLWQHEIEDDFDACIEIITLSVENIQSNGNK